MQNPRLFIRVDGEQPSLHPLLGYRVPLDYDNIVSLITKHTEGVPWRTIQIKIIPSLINDISKVIVISDEFKHISAPPEHSVFLLIEKTKELIMSAETLQELFNKIEGN